MSDIDPPVKLDDSGNEESMRYILDEANQPDFDYPQVLFVSL